MENVVSGNWIHQIIVKFFKNMSNKLCFKILWNYIFKITRKLFFFFFCSRSIFSEFHRKKFLWLYIDTRLGILLNCLPFFSDESKNLWTKSHIPTWCVFSAPFIKKLWAISSELVSVWKKSNKTNKPCRNWGCKPNVIEVNHTNQTDYNVTTIYSCFSSPTHKIQMNFFFLFL